MKRKIRSVILVGVMVLSILLLSTQPVQADPPQRYSGWQITLDTLLLSPFLYMIYRQMD